MAEESTTIQVSINTWQRLSFRKEPGDSFDDVITELLDKVEDLEEKEEE